MRYLSVLDALSAELEATADKALGGPEEQERARKVVEREVGEVQEGASPALPSLDSAHRLCAAWRARRGHE